MSFASHDVYGQGGHIMLAGIVFQMGTSRYHRVQIVLLTQSPAAITIYVTLASEFILRFVDLCNEYYGLGRDVKHSRLVAFCHQVPGVFGVVKLEVSYDGASWVEADWPITYREIARFDTGRVTVESAIIVTE